MARSSKSALGSARVPVALSAWDYVMQRPLRTLLVVLLFGVFRFISGRDMIKGGRRSDATFFRPARKVRTTVWHRLPGYARFAIRMLVVGVVAAWFAGYTALVWAAVAVFVVALVWVGIKQQREERHHETYVKPVWPAVANIIQVDPDEDPSRWLDVPGNLASPESDPITVGLPTAAADDDRRVSSLVNLFTQRLGHRVWARIDYAARLVELRRRPEEPDVWPAVADILEVRESELAEDWMTISPYIEDGRDPADSELPANDRKALAEQRKQDATVVVTLPVTVVDHRPIAEQLVTLACQRYGGKWEARADRVKRQVKVFRQRPEPTPPANVDFLAEHPDYRTEN